MVVPLMEGQRFKAIPVVPDFTGAEEVVEGVVEDEAIFVGAWVVGAILSTG